MAVRFVRVWLWQPVPTCRQSVFLRGKGAQTLLTMLQCVLMLSCLGRFQALLSGCLRVGACAPALPGLRQLCSWLPGS